jgi:hypothetical protein
MYFKWCILYLFSSFTVQFNSLSLLYIQPLPILQYDVPCVCAAWWCGLCVVCDAMAMQDSLEVDFAEVDFERVIWPRPRLPLLCHAVHANPRHIYPSPPPSRQAQGRGQDKAATGAERTLRLASTNFLSSSSSSSSSSSFPYPFYNAIAASFCVNTPVPSLSS